MTVILKATSEADLLSLFPALLGFTPHDSVVLLAFRGKRTCGTVRIDLPSGEHPEIFSKSALNAIGIICKIPGADGVAFAVFTPEAFGESASVPRQDFADVLLDRIYDSGLRLKDGFCRGSDGWASYVPDGESQERVPEGGHPLTLLDDSPRDDLPERPDASDGRDLPDRVAAAGPGQRRHLREHLEAIEAAVERIKIVWRAHPEATDDDIDRMLGDDLDLVAATQDFAAFAESALEWTPETLDERGAMLLYGITRPPVRDDVMLLWAFGPDDPALDQIRRGVGHGGKNRSERRRAGSGRSRRASPVVASPVVDIGDRMTGFGPRPDPDRMLRATDILLHLIARAEGRDRLAPLCMVAWLSWGLGRASHAAKYIGEVRDIDPGYGMGEVLSGVFTVFPLPEWAFAEPEIR